MCTSVHNHTREHMSPLHSWTWQMFMDVLRLMWLSCVRKVSNHIFITSSSPFEYGIVTLLKPLSGALRYASSSAYLSAEEIVLSIITTAPDRSLCSTNCNAGKASGAHTSSTQPSAEASVEYTHYQATRGRQWVN